MAAKTSEAYFWRGLDTYKVPMSMHKENRERLMSLLKDAGATTGVVLLEGGPSTTSYDSDHEPLFRQDSHFQYLFGAAEADLMGAIDLSNGKAHLFVPKLPASYGTWMGKIQPPSFYRDRYATDEAHYTCDVASVMESLKPEKIYVMRGINSDSGNEAKPATFDGIAKFAVDETTLHPIMFEARTIKSPKELDLMRHICAVSSEAHIKVMQSINPGMMEYQLESVFLDHCYRNHGCRHVSYTCICGSGDNASILHYGHAGAPNDKNIQDGDIMLMDMGANYHGYCSDITCSFPANGKFTQDQKDIYNIVLAANRAVIEAMEPGVPYPEMHELAERVTLKGLVDMGILKGDVEDMMKVYLGAVFQPHGLGHLMGLDTHDVGGYPPGTERSTRPGLRSLRCGRKLQERMVITVEPGLYFIDHLLDEALANPEQAKFFTDKLEKFRNFGGVRVEDNIIVRGVKGGEIMTRVPRTIEDIEYVMAGGVWPRPEESAPKKARTE